jgi:hypothetical protein
VVLADTSAWVEYLRGTGSLAHRRLRELIEREAPLAITEVAHLELLAGASDPDHVTRLRRFLGRFELLPVQGLADYEVAADLYRRCRVRGETVRKLEDCLVAAVPCAMARRCCTATTTST